MAWIPGRPWGPLGADEIAELHPVHREEYLRRQAENVFGVDFKTDRNGKPVETGIGSEHNMTIQARQALELEAARKAELRQAAGLKEAEETA
jgi:hypothetical protein